jgi:hypothetical protein
LALDYPVKGRPRCFGNVKKNQRLAIHPWENDSGERSLDQLLTPRAPKPPVCLRELFHRRIRRNGVKDFAQSTALVNGLDDVMGSTWLRVKLDTR